MRILVTGATGVIGMGAVPLLLERGHRVTAVGRSRERLKLLSTAGASTATVELFDRDAVTHAVAGHEAVVNLATRVPSGLRAFLPGAWEETARIRKTASAIVADAVIAAGAGRLVQESFAGIYPDSGAGWIDETLEPRPAKYNKTALDAEQSAQRVTEAGGSGVALRFALLYGAAGDRFTRDFLAAANRGVLALPGRTDAYASMITHEDAASAVVAALGVPAGIYNVVDDEPLTRRALAATLGEILGRRAPRVLPRWLALLGGGIGETVARSLRVSNRKLRDAGAWAPRYPSAREGWRAAHDWASRGVGGPDRNSRRRGVDS